MATANDRKAIQGNKIMLVEDDSSMQSVLRTLLELEGYQVTVAPQGKRLDDIIQSIRDAHPDILLLDVHLRDISGFDIVQRIRADAETKPMRVIMTSGMAVKEQSLSAGADDFLLKPYMPDELLNKLHG